jgi:hypothetical protein
MNNNPAATRLPGRLSYLAALLIFAAAPGFTQEIRYSWFEISYAWQDVSRMGSQLSLADPLQPQRVDVNAQDGNGIKFRGSIGTWKNMYAFLEFASTDPDVIAVVTNTITGASAEGQDEFDYTTIRGGIGLRYPIGFTTDLYGELSYDSLDLDFGSFAGENNDTDSQDFGAAIGVRKMFGDNLELRAYGRYTNVGDVDLNDPPGAFDADTLFGVGFGFTLIRGLSITGDYESGELSNWNVGFRLDLDED